MHTTHPAKNRQNGYIVRLRKHGLFIPLSILLTFSVLSSLITPTSALSDGPGQPETRPFQHDGIQQHVDLFSGAFQYSIPLFNVGPYPFQLSYNSDISTEQEASWVGLGWNLSTGSIDRNVRGFPDDFMKDTISEERNQKQNINVSLRLSVTDPELFTFETPDLAKKLIKKLLGTSSVSASAGVTFVYNNYSGLSFSKSGTVGLNFTTETFYALRSKIGFSTGDGGLTISPSFSYDKVKETNIRNTKYSVGSMGFSYNSLKGIQHANFGFFNEKLGLSGMNGELSFPPYSPFPVKNSAFAFNPKSGLTLTFADLGISIGASYGMQKLAEDSIQKRAYGYLYMAGKTGSTGELLDFTREKDNGYSPGNPYLPQTFSQPDVFSVSTPFVNGPWRAFQNTACVVSSPATANLSDQTSVDFGIEFGGGSATDFGGNIGFNQTCTQSVPWTDKNSAYSGAVSASGSFALSTPYRNVYFRSMNPSSKSPVTNFSPAAVRYELSGNGFNYNLLGDPAIVTGKYNSIQNVREPYVFQPLTRDVFEDHPFFSNRYQPYASPEQKSHHIAAIRMKDDSGNEFLFACPAINHIQKEVAFTVEGNNTLQSPFIAYTATDASTLNQKGNSNYYNSRTTPGYAYAYLLTDLYTSEYSDLTGDGPTPDDPGDYVLFSYAKKIDHYKWRTPYTESEHIAAYNPNLLTQRQHTSDDIATYTYGEKDIWYIDTVRSKNEMAVFFTSPRRDAFEAKSEHGGKGPRSMHRLDSVHVYTIHNYYQSKQQLINPLPDKRVVFRYNYSQCKGVYNQANTAEGKLTLTEVIITDYKTHSGFRHSYRFSYDPHNPAYNPLYTDRWGNYDETSPALMNKLEFPFTQPGDTLYAGAWRLNRIQLPSGGSISVEYESGSYRYVQNRPAMQMYPVAGVSNVPGSFSNMVHNGTPNQEYYIFFKTDIPSSTPLSEAQQQFSRYFDAATRNNLYFRVLTNISPSVQHMEYVYGFAETNETALVKISNIYYGRIRLKGTPVGKNLSSDKISPITRAAIHFGLVNTPRLTFGHPDLNSYLGQPLQFVNQFVQDFLLSTNILNNLITTLKGPHKKLFDDGIGQTIVPEKSYIRLLSPGDKPGGSSRVKRVVYDNSWNAMSPGETGSSITKEYRYTLEDGSSSGVAAYEPQTGGEELPQHVPYSYRYSTQSHALANWARNLVPHPEFMGLFPLCESAYPSARVGYARVTEVTLGQNQSTNGKVVTEFYTTKEYPTEVRATPLQEKTPSMELDAIFAKIEKKHCAVSQGFSVVTNNMNGQEKAVFYYDGNERLLKKIRNIYSPSGAASFYFDNNQVSSGYVGLERDITLDFREEFASTTGNDLRGNSNTTLVPLPLGLITVLGGNLLSEVYFRSATVNTVWYQQAVLVKQEVEDRGTRLDIRNAYRNPVTGNPLITATANAWDKNTWSYTLPAYYVHPAMGVASGMTGHQLKISTNSQGVITAGSTGLLHDGDRLLINGSPSKFAWVYRNGNTNYLIDVSGMPVASLSNAPAYLWDAGRRNLLHHPAHSITARQLPAVTSNTLPSFSAAHEILASNATLYRDWYSYRCAECGCAPEWITDSLAVYPAGRSPEPVWIPYTIRKSCTCDGIITLYPPQHPALFFNWPGQNRWGVYVQGLCAGTAVSLEIYSDSTQPPIATHTFTVPQASSSGFGQQQQVNPFVHKLKNAWIPCESYVYNTQRIPVSTGDPVQLKQQGQYTQFVPFWTYGTGWVCHKNDWLLTEKNTFANASGQPVESRNIIGNYNTETYSHKGQIQESLTMNARSNESGFDSFEDYYPFYHPYTTEPWQHAIDPSVAEHFRLAAHRKQWVSLERPHTGYYSLKIPKDSSLVKTCQAMLPPSDTTSIALTPPPFYVQPPHCSDLFAPTPEKKYLVSFWFYKSDTALSGLQFKVLFDHSPLTLQPEYISPVVEGWRQYTLSFFLSGRQCGLLEFILTNQSQQAVYIDDFRVHPYNATMNSYVYDPFTHRMVAGLDENNFAVIYQYDAMQQVQNTIRETEKGRIYLNYRLKHLFLK